MSLYRKYRSQSLEEIIGQDHVVQTLTNALASEKVAHAYLFAGPRGTGKTSVARILARELGADDLDTIEIDAASHRGIDEVRALREQVLFQPVASKKKVYILDEVHMLTKEAFNALLKTLEEPPVHVHFVLCTTEPYKIPATIISRTQRFDFHPGSQENVKELVNNVAVAEGRVLPDEVISIIAKRADGGYRDALSLLEQVMEVSEGDDYVEKVRHALGLVLAAEVDEFIAALLAKDSQTALGVISTLSDRQTDLNHFVKEILHELRVILLNDSGPRQQVDVKMAVLSVSSAAKEMRYTPIPSLPLELAVLSYCNNEQSIVSEVSSEKKGLVTLPQQENSEVTQKQVNSVQHRSSSSSGAAPNWWPDVLVAIKPHNHTLEALLKGCTPGEVHDGIIDLNFKYKFHKERIEEPENKAIVVQVIQEVSGQQLAVNCLLVDRMNDQNGSQRVAQPTTEVTIDPKKQQNKQKSGKKKGDNADTIQAEEMLERAMNDLGGKIISE